MKEGRGRTKGERGKEDEDENKEDEEGKGRGSDGGGDTHIRRKISASCRLQRIQHTNAVCQKKCSTWQFCAAWHPEMQDSEVVKSPTHTGASRARAL